MKNKDTIILAIESSCDDTSASILKNNVVLSNIIANQSVHESYGGVVPELASRAHQANIVPVVQTALKKAEINVENIDAIAFTRGPGLLGSLLVGVSFAKALALSRNLPLIEVNHMKAHILAHFINDNNSTPTFPFLCLTVSGGHTQIVLVKDYLEMEVIGKTIDDAAGEAFDKAAKMLGLKYPGGPLIDKYAKLGDPLKYKFPKSKIGELDFSFSGLKTSFLYFLQKEMKKDSNFISENMNDLCASIQHTIIQTLMIKLEAASDQTGIKEIAIAGGVSANSGLRAAIEERQTTQNWTTHIPEFQYCTDNAAMIGIVGYYKYLKQDFVGQDVVPDSRLKI